jgi:dolichyl-phosphate-mannose-protein mannosyltransferase
VSMPRIMSRFEGTLAGARPRPGRVEAFSAFARVRQLDAALLGLLVVSITALNLLWVSLEDRPPHWDESRHLERSLLFHEHFAGGELGSVLTAYYDYPPGVYWITDALYALLGTTDAWAAVLAINVVFLPILVFATYAIGKSLWSRRVGLLAAAFVVASPMIISLFRDFMLDAPLTAMVALALYLLIASDSFSARRPSLLLGAVCGLGVLTKWTFPFYVALPLVVAVVAATRASVRTGTTQRLLNVGGAALLASVIGAPWYVSNLGALRRTLDSANEVSGALDGDPPVTSAASIFWYAWNLLSNQLYLVPFLLFLAGVGFVLQARGSAPRNLYPILTILGTYVGGTLLLNKDARYTLPMLPAVAVVAVHWLDYLGGRLRNALTGGFLAYGAATFAAISFGISGLPDELFVDLDPGGPVSAIPETNEQGATLPRSGVRIWAQDGFLNGPPSGENWHQEDLFEEAARSPKRALFYQGPLTIWFNGFAMQYYGLKHNVTWVATPEEADVAGIRTAGDQRVTAPGGFNALRFFSLPDGSTLRLFRRTEPPTIPTGPALASLADLRRLSDELGHPVYWAGPMPGFRYEVRRTSDGKVYIRYLPSGVAVGEPRSSFLTVATYPFPGAYSAVRAIAQRDRSQRLHPPGRVVAVVNASYPNSVHVAFPDVEYQVEVYDPSPARARQVVARGQVAAIP